MVSNNGATAPTNRIKATLSTAGSSRSLVFLSFPTCDPLSSSLSRYDTLRILLEVRYTVSIRNATYAKGINMERKNQNKEDSIHGTRRRGNSLEADILQAAWEELSVVGYSRFTMEGVAARAHTSKTVIYRRWTNRAELVLAAMRQRGPVISGEVPNTGELRSDVVALLNRVSRRMQEVGMETIHGVISEYVGDNPVSAFLSGRQAGYESMRRILKHASDRGDVNLDELSPRIMTLPVDLARHEFLTTHQPLSESTIVAIVDEIFLPLVRAAKLS